MKNIKTIELNRFFNAVDGNPQAQEHILSSILAKDNSQYYKDFEELCSEARLYQAEK